MSATIGRGVAAALFTLLVFALWQAAVDSKLVSRVFVAAPLSALEVIVERGANGSLFTTTGATAQRLFAGWIAAVAIAMALGTAIGNSRTAYEYLAPTLEFFRPLPASAVIPVAVLFLGLSAKMSTAVIAVSIE